MAELVTLWLNHLIAASIIRAFEKDIREHLIISGEDEFQYRNSKTGKTYSLKLREENRILHHQVDSLGFVDLTELCEENATRLGIENEDIKYIIAFGRDFRELRNDVAHSRNVTPDKLKKMQESITYIFNRSNKGGGGINFALSGILIKKGFVPSPEDLQVYAVSEESIIQKRALERRNQLDMSQSNIMAASLFSYYVQAGKSKPVDSRYGLYRSLDGSERLLTFVTRQSWNEVLTIGHAPKLVSNYIDPENLPLPELPPIRHTPHRIKMGRYDLMDLGPYCLRSVESDEGSLQLNFSEMPFFSWYDRYSDLEDEFIGQLPVLVDEGKILVDADLPLREQFLPDLRILFDSSSRLTAGGIVVLTIIPVNEEASDALLLVEQRSGEVADGQGLLTTIPRGFHDRFASSHKDYDLEQTVMREVAEEVFNKSGLHKGEVDTEAYFDACPPVADLRRTGAYTLQPTCFGFDLLKGNFTVTYVMVIEDRTWWPKYRHQQGMNYEFSMDGGSKSVLLSDMLRIERLLKRADWTTEGYVAFTEGLRQLPQLLKERAGMEKLLQYAEQITQILPSLDWKNSDEVLGKLTAYSSQTDKQ